MKAREKRRRRALRMQRKRCQAEAIRYWSEDPGWMSGSISDSALVATLDWLVDEPGEREELHKLIIEKWGHLF
jgi:hypothetical protein